MRGRLVALGLSVYAAALSACASPPPPPLAPERYAVGRDLRFWRILRSSAKSEGLAGLPGEPKGIDFRGDAEMLVRRREEGTSGPGFLEVRLGACALWMRGLRGDVSFDTRDPGTLKALEGRPEGPGILKELNRAQAEGTSYGLLPDGTLDGNPSSGSEDPPGGFPGLRIGWFPGALCLGQIETGTIEGASWRIEAAIPVGLSGVRYDEPLPVAGTWTFSKWEADSGTATLVFKGGARTPDERLRTTRVESCEIRGQATWDPRLGLVTHSYLTAHVVLVALDNPSIRIDWTLNLDEALLL